MGKATVALPIYRSTQPLLCPFIAPLNPCFANLSPTYRSLSLFDPLHLRVALFEALVELLQRALLALEHDVGVDDVLGPISDRVERAAEQLPAVLVIATVRSETAPKTRSRDVTRLPVVTGRRLTL